MGGLIPYVYLGEKIKATKIALKTKAKENFKARDKDITTHTKKSRKDSTMARARVGFLGAIK